MKKIFFSFAAFTAMLLMVGCGGSDGGSSSGGYSGGGNYSECSYGSYECSGGDSYWCGYAGGSDDLTWQLSERCSYSCDDSTGKCTSGSSGENGGGNSGGGNSGGSNAAYQTCCDLAYCFDACSDQNCYDNCVNNSSSVAINDYNYIFECGDIFGCDPDGDGYYDSSCLSTYCGSYLINCCYAVDNGGDDDCEKEKIECNQDPFAEMMGYYEEISQHCYRETCDSVWHCDTSETCPNGCNFSTGFCNSSSGGGNSGGGGGSTSECTSGQYMCSGSSSYYCSYGSWSLDQNCSNGCNSSTGRCNSSSGGSGGGGSTSECTSGQYMCSGSSSYYCSYGSWSLDQNCSNGCDSSTGKCKSSSGGGSTTGYKPCISSFSGLSTNSSINLYWTTTTSGNCGKAETFTIVWADVGCYSNYGESCAVSKELSGSSKSYSLNNATEYLWSDSSSIFFTLYARNSYGEDFDGLNCEYNDSMGWFSCN
ncbi:hypothetical protein IKO70_04525 [bacterium]|nr:hypothetical protein [bacterium]